MTSKILIRFDDICPTMNFDQFQIAEKLMDKYGIKPLIGVIPDCKDKDLLISESNINFWNYIKSLQSKGYAVAMHGVNHVFDSSYKGVVNNRIGSEFSGHTLEQQVQKIQEGKRILQEHGIYTDKFFAPAHSYDDNTIRALSICGFKYMSDGKSVYAYEKYGVKLLPCRSGGCPKNLTSGYVTAVFHAHEWVLPQKSYCFQQFCNLLEKYSANVVTFDDYKQQKSHNALLQQLNEKMYVFYEYHIYPSLRSLYHSIFK